MLVLREQEVAGSNPVAPTDSSESPATTSGVRGCSSPDQDGPFLSPSLVLESADDRHIANLPLLSHHRRANGETYMKRIVALPGDTIAMRDDTLFVDGRIVVEPYATPTGDAGLARLPEFDWQRRFLARPSDSSGYQPTLSTWGPLLVPSGSYFLLGDHRAESLDCRYAGPVPADSVIRRPVAIYCSRDPASGRIRWRRIGRDVSQ
jgi:signal peptidase I